MFLYSDKRSSQPSIKNLETSLDNAEIRLDKLMQLKINDYKDISDSLI